MGGSLPKGRSELHSCWKNVSRQRKHSAQTRERLPNESKGRTEIKAGAEEMESYYGRWP